MKQSITLIISLLFAISAISQNSEFSNVTKSEVFPIEKPYNIKGFYKLKSGNIVNIRDDGEFLEIVKFDSDMKQISISKQLKFTYKQEEAKNYFRSTYLTRDDKVIIVFEQKYKAEDKIIIWANIINLETEELEFSEPVKLADIFYKNQIFDYHFSFDEKLSKFVFVNYLPKEDSKKQNIISLKVFDCNLEKLWENNIEDIFVISSPAGIFRIAENGKVVAVIPIRDKTIESRDKTQQKTLF